MEVRVPLAEVSPGDRYFGAEITEVLYSEEHTEAVLLCTNPDGAPVVFRLPISEKVPVVRGPNHGLGAVLPVKVTTYTVQVISRVDDAPGNIYDAMDEENPWLAAETAKVERVYTDLAEAQFAIAQMHLDEESVREALTDDY